jgi:hypothetical protein
MTIGSTLIPQGKVREFMDVTATAGGSSEQYLNVENDAVTITCHIESFGGNTIFDLKIESIGDKSTDKVVIASFPQLTSGLGVRTLTVPCTGKILVTVDYTGPVAFQLRGKGVGAAAVDGAKPVTIEESVYQQGINAAILDELRCTRMAVERAVNHLREITGIEADTGDDY